MIIRFIKWVAEKVALEADGQFHSWEAIQRELMSLSEELENDGDMSEEEYKERETQLLETLAKTEFQL